MSNPKRIVTDLDREAGQRIKELFDVAKSVGKFKSQEDLAAALDVTQPFLSAIMNKKVACPTEKILRLAEIFGVSPKAIRSDLPDIRPAGGEEIDEKLMEDVLSAIFQVMKEKGINIEKVSDGKIAKLAIKAYKMTQETNKLDRRSILLALELIA